MSRISKHCRIISAAIAGIHLLVAGPIAAEPQLIEIAADKDWRHKWTAMAFPARLGHFERTSVRQHQDRESDVAARYWSDETKTLLSLYIYRPGNPDPSLWHDRAVAAIAANKDLGQVDFTSRSTGFFIPPGGTTESGVGSVMSTDSDYKSTGVALYSADEWLVKVRVSSQELGVEELERELAAVISGLPALQSVSSTAAYAIEPCEESIVFAAAARPAKDLVDPMMVAVTGGILAVPVPVDEAERSRIEPVEFCRDGEGEAQYALYRPNGATDRYVLGLGDSGFSVDVGPALTLDAVLKADGKQSGMYSVSTSDALVTKIFFPFSSMPTPEQAGDAALREGPVAAVSRPLGDEGSNITIFTEEQETGEVEDEAVQ